MLRETKSRISPAPKENFTDEFFHSTGVTESDLGYAPSITAVLAHRPSIALAYNRLAKAIMFEAGEVSAELRFMVANLASHVTGCRYCEAHTANFASETGFVDDAKVAALWEFEQSSLFSPAERAAFRFALASASVPNAVEDDHVQELKKFYSDAQIVEILSVICFYGFANRWHDSLATPLQERPLNYAQKVLRPVGWDPGKHAPANATTGL